MGAGVVCWRGWLDGGGGCARGKLVLVCTWCVCGHGGERCWTVFWGGTLFWTGEGIGIRKVPAAVLVSLGETEGFTNWGLDKGEQRVFWATDGGIRTEAEFGGGF